MTQAAAKGIIDGRGGPPATRRCALIVTESGASQEHSPDLNGADGNTTADAPNKTHTAHTQLARACGA